MYAFYDNPSIYDGKNVLTMSRTGQTNQVHSFVVGHNWILSSTLVNALHVTYNKTVNDRTMQEYFTAADLGSNVYSPQPGFMGVNVSGGFGDRRRRAPTPASSTRTASRSPTTST